MSHAEERAALVDQADSLVDDATAHVANEQYTLAATALEKALALDPHNTGAAEVKEIVSRQAKEVVAGAWRYRETTDPMDDSQATVASLLSQGSERERARIIVRCRGKELDLFMTAPQSFRADAVRVRFDDKPPIRVSSGRSDNGDATFLRDRDRKVLRAMTQHSRVLIEVTGLRAPSIFTFDLAGADVAVERVVSRCGGWPKKPKPERVCNKPWPERCDWESNQ